MENSRFIRACWGKPVDAVPVWFMRQAGRYQSSYRALRQRYTLMELATDPVMCSEVTCRPVEDLGVDAAILFSDIMVPLGPMGIGFEIRENVGPIVARPIRTLEDVERLQVVEPRVTLTYTLEAIERATGRLGSTPLIGFAGGPFTLASYCIEGGPSREYLFTKQLMWHQPEVFGAFMERLAQTVGLYLRAQIEAGASAIQLFDSWIGALSEADYRRFVLPHVKTIFDTVRPLGVPMIYFGVNTTHLLSAMKEAGPTVVGLDWRVRIGDVRRQMGPAIALQGNLDPIAILAGWGPIERLTKDILNDMVSEPGFIFNLGHGVHKTTDPDVLKNLVDFVHQYSREAMAHV